MVDKRNIRRDAERKAREALGGDLVTTVGDLAMATAERSDASDTVDAARTRGEELIAAAKQQADKLVTDAQESLDSVEARYGKSYTAAREAGWTTTQLKSLGYTRPATRKINGREVANTYDSDPDAKPEVQEIPRTTEVPKPDPAMSAAS